jgi:parvulin-like peptidyl-prolyl isomerase
VRARPSHELAFFLAVSTAALSQEALVDRVAVSVNDVAIPESAVRRAIVLGPLEREPGESREAFRARVLDELVDQYLQYEDAMRFGPSPPDAAEVEAALARLRSRLQGEGKEANVEFARAGMTAEDVRASVERQLVVQRYLRERFRQVAPSDEQSLRAEYERYVPERRAANLPVLPYDQVADALRERAQQRAFDEEVEKWLKELREKARITFYPIPTPAAGQGTPVVLATAPPATRTPASAN